MASFLLCEFVYTAAMNETETKFMPEIYDPQRSLEVALQTLQIEADALLTLKQRIANDSSGSLSKAVSILLECSGRVVVSGIGKSGHIARKIAATLSSTGTPAFFIHPAEAAHGDLGMIKGKDVFIAISYSGEAAELISIVPIIKRMGGKLIAMTGNAYSGLGQLADVHLDVKVEQEACTLNLAPTASTTATLALGDALAISLLDAKGFLEEDFARSHPGGALGRRLLTHVRDIMRKNDAIPMVTPDTPLSAALLEITNKGIAMTAIVDEQRHVVGIFTDGDLRRLFEDAQDYRRLSIGDVMSHNPRCIGPNQLAVEAVSMMEQYRVNQLLVADAEGKLVGALHIHDLTNAKVI